MRKNHDSGRRMQNHLKKHYKREWKQISWCFGKLQKAIVLSFKNLNNNGITILRSMFLVIHMFPIVDVVE